MKGNFQVRFLEEGEGAISPSYSAIFTDTKSARIRVIRANPRSIGGAIILSLFKY